MSEETLQKYLDALKIRFKQSEDTEKQKIELEQKTLEKKLGELSTDNKEFEITLEYLLDLVYRVNSLYESSRIDKKRKILKLVFSNFWLNSQKLSYDIKKPFDMFVKGAYCLFNWEKVDGTLTNFKSEIIQLKPYILNVLSDNEEYDL